MGMGLICKFHFNWAGTHSHMPWKKKSNTEHTCVSTDFNREMLLTSSLGGFAKVARQGAIAAASIVTFKIASEKYFP